MCRLSRFLSALILINTLENTFCTVLVFFVDILFVINC